MFNVNDDEDEEINEHIPQDNEKTLSQDRLLQTETKYTYLVSGGNEQDLPFQGRDSFSYPVVTHIVLVCYTCYMQSQ